MASPRERTYRRPDDRRLVPTRPDDRRLVPSRPDDRRLVDPPRVHRHHFHDVPPWPHQHHRDYVYVDRGGWWPRWYPYWDPQWYAYWWQLYDYYGGDAYPEYAEYARDAFIRQSAPQWGLSVSGSYGSYGSAQVGMQPYGVTATESYYRRDPSELAALRARGLDQAKKVYAALGVPYIGLRSTPWGGEVVAFGQRSGLQRWVNEQAQDTDVSYAVAFDLTVSASPVSEVAR